MYSCQSSVNIFFWDSLDILMAIGSSYFVRTYGKAGIFVPDILNIRPWLSLMNRCCAILLARGESWIYAREWEWWENERYENYEWKNELSVDSVRCKLNPVERDVNSRMNSFISWWRELGVLGPYTKVIPFCPLRFSAVTETRKLGCRHDSVDSLLRSRAICERENHIFRHGLSINLHLPG